MVSQDCGKTPPVTDYLEHSNCTEAYLLVFGWLVVVVLLGVLFFVLFCFPSRLLYAAPCATTSTLTLYGVNIYGVNMVLIYNSTLVGVEDIRKSLCVFLGHLSSGSIYPGISTQSMSSYTLISHAEGNGYTLPFYTFHSKVS